MKKCKFCGAENNDIGKFCENCGKPLEDNVTPLQSNPAFNSYNNTMNNQQNYASFANNQVNQGNGYIPNQMSNQVPNMNNQKPKSSKTKSILFTILVVVLLLVAIFVVVVIPIISRNKLNEYFDNLDELEDMIDDFSSEQNAYWKDKTDNSNNQEDKENTNTNTNTNTDINNNTTSNNNSTSTSLFKDISGNWVTEANECYRFDENGTFYWYQSYSNTNDNYYKGTFEVLNGKDAFEALNAPMESVEEIITLSNGVLKYEDFYAIKAYPTYLISGGIDKSSTNLEDDMCFDFLVIKTSDTTAQMLNYMTYSTLTLTKK